ncbi:Large polyvalent protein associated domain-containing protein, partial [Dysosmobacter welbionis]
GAAAGQRVHRGRPAPRRHRGHRRHPRTGIQTLFTHHRRPGGRRQQADPHPVRHQGRRADGEPAEDAHRHEQGHPGDPHQDLRPAPQHADHGVPVSRQAEAEVSGDYGDLRPHRPPAGYAAHQVGAGGPVLKISGP